MAVDIEKAVQDVREADYEHDLWLGARFRSWLDENIRAGIDETDPTTFNQDDIDALKVVLEKLGSDTRLQLYAEITNFLEILTSAMLEAVEEAEEADDQDSFSYGLDLRGLQSRLEAEGWMTDEDWKNFGIRQGGDCINEKVMRDIASRWDADRLSAFPNHSKFERMVRELPQGQEHFIITTFEWKVIMGSFDPVSHARFSTDDNQHFVMWKLENGKDYVDWCKRSKKGKTIDGG